uniref:Uncharacterized protein n=1 Tax=Kalanchoe fedtschenkoi TaxID=63787 RepID=A0A7N0VM58_KALFE
MESDVGEEFRVGVSDSGVTASVGSSDLSGELNCSEDLVGVPESFGYEFWTRDPDSVRNRRQKFLEWMDLGMDRASSDGELVDEKYGSNDRIVRQSGAVLRATESEDDFSSSRSSWSDEATDLGQDGAAEDALVCKVRDLDNGAEFVIGEPQREGLLYRIREVGSNRLVSLEEFQRALGSSKLVQRFLRKQDSARKDVADGKKKVKNGWLGKLSAFGCMVDVHKEIDIGHLNIKPTVGSRIRDVKVHPHKKHSKELSSLLSAQDFLAHKGSILTMKFSPDGQFLASGGEDGVVRVWKVIETDRSKRVDLADSDLPNLYTALSNLSKSSLESLDADKEKLNKAGTKKLSDLAPVIVPPKVFSIREKPLHEYKGHCDQVLDLSWSKKGHLLSSSVDKTVRLWKIGHDCCLAIFAHNNYVTSVQFNPENEDYFISGSIDGKVRIWEVQGCQVVDWTDTKEIITAVCYRPDGMGGIVGSLTGNCLVYSIRDNHLELDNQVSLQGKKKLQGKRITGFQFSPCDPSKVMVTSADSAVRILCGIEVICKLKGSRSSSQTSASFTADGKHIVSANEDSNVHVWNYVNQEKSATTAKTIESYESFSSQNASIAIPWPGVKKSRILPDSLSTSPIGYSSQGAAAQHGHDVGGDNTGMSLSSRDLLSMSRGFLLDFLTKGTSTWPEEKLPTPSPHGFSPAAGRFEYKFLKSACQSLFSSPHLWGLVIVTAGWDGRIRTFLNYGLPMRL